MKKTCFILSLAGVAALAACSTQELESPANLQNGMLMVRPIMPEVDIETKADLPTIYAFIPEELNAGTVNPVLPKINSGNTYYYNLEGVGSDVVFSNQDLSYAVSPRYDENGFSLVKTDQYSADLGTELLFGVATGIQTGNTEPYEVRLNRFSSSVQFKFMAYNTDGNELPAETFQYADATLGGFATELRFGSDITTSAPAPYGNTYIAESAALQDGQWLSTPRNVIPGTEQMDYDVNITLSDGTSGNFKGSLGRTLEANHSYIITFRFRQANGSSSFEIEEPEVYTETFTIPEKSELFSVESNYILGKEAGSNIQIPVQLEIQYDWEYELTEGTGYFSVERIGNSLSVTTLSENTDETRNGIIRLSTAAGHYHEIYITQMNASKQMITYTPANGYQHYLVVYGENLQIDRGSGFEEMVSGEGINPSGTNTTTIQGDCITAVRSTGIWASCSFSNCVSLTDLETSLEAGSFDASPLPALRHLTLDNSTISTLTFAEGQQIETLSCRECGSIVNLNLNSICTTLKELDLYRCSSIESVEIYPQSFTEERLLEKAEFSYCIAMPGISLINYTRLENVAIDGCSAMESINLSGCTALVNLGISKNSATYINLSNCTSLKYLSINDMEVDNLICSGCTALEKFMLPSYYSSTITTFDMSGLPALREIYLAGTLNCTSFNISNCPQIESISGNSGISCNSLDISNCPKLKRFSAGYRTTEGQVLNMEGSTALEEISLSYYKSQYDFSQFTNLRSLYLYNSAITDINLSGCASFEELTYDSGELTSMSLPTTLKSLDLNYITMSDGISLNSYPSLVSFSLEDCDNIPYVDLNGCSALISCSITRNDALTSINISGCSSLTECDVEYNSILQSLNMDNCSSLTGFSPNSLPELNYISLANCSSLLEYSVTDCKITSLDFSTCPQINTIDCRNNMLDEAALNSMFTSVPDRSSNVSTGKLYISGNPGAETCDESIIFSKNWYFPNN